MGKIRGRNSLVLNINQPLSMGISKVTLMRWPKVDFGLVERIVNLVREDAGGETRDELGDFVLMRGLEDVVVYEEVLAEEVELVFHVLEEAAD